MTLQQMLDEFKKHNENMQKGSAAAAGHVSGRGGHLAAPDPGYNGGGAERAPTEADFIWDKGVTEYGKRGAVSTSSGIYNQLFDYDRMWNEAMQRESDAAKERGKKAMLENLGKGALVMGSLAVGGVALGGAGALQAGATSLLGSVGLPALTLAELGVGAYAVGEGIKSLRTGSNPDITVRGMDFEGFAVPSVGRNPEISERDFFTGGLPSGGGGLNMTVERPSVEAGYNPGVRVEGIIFEGMV